MYDVLIVGGGLFGATFARECLNANKRVLVIDKREHIAGNCYTESRHGIEAHVYGPHIFHTNSETIWNYVRQFATFNTFVNRPKVHYAGRLYSFPINLFTLYQLWGVQTPEAARQKLAEVRVPIARPDNLEEWILSQVGEEIYRTFIYGYTKKQWRREPRDLPAAIVRRLPIRLNFDDNYFNDVYQGVPAAGYTAMITEMLSGADVVLGVDYFAQRDVWDARARTVVFTGCLDQFYEYKHGALEYRTLRFESELYAVPDYQGNAIINYTDEAVAFTRSIEHRHFVGGSGDCTYVTREYPETWRPDSVPYYPIDDARNRGIYAAYAQAAKAETKYVFGGRLAEYRYYDMHQVIGSALTTAKQFLHKA